MLQCRHLLWPLLSGRFSIWNFWENPCFKELPVFYSSGLFLLPCCRGGMERGCRALVLHNSKIMGGLGGLYQAVSVERTSASLETAVTCGWGWPSSSEQPGVWEVHLMLSLQGVQLRTALLEVCHLCFPICPWAELMSEWFLVHTWI